MINHRTNFILIILKLIITVKIICVIIRGKTNKYLNLLAKKNIYKYKLKIIDRALEKVKKEKEDVTLVFHDVQKAFVGVGHLHLERVITNSYVHQGYSLS